MKDRPADNVSYVCANIILFYEYMI